jgi:predicted kinase
MTNTPKPRCIIVTGRPASGKTTLSSRLAQDIPCPLISRDAIKEGLVNTWHGHDTTMDMNKQVYEVFFQTIDLLIGQSITILIEAAFQHKLWVEPLSKLQDIADIRLIICSVDEDMARARFIERGKANPTRAQFHDDWAEDQHLSKLRRLYHAPELDVPTLNIDTSDGYNPAYSKILDFIRQPHIVEHRE